MAITLKESDGIYTLSLSPEEMKILTLWSEDFSPALQRGGLLNQLVQSAIAERGRMQRNAKLAELTDRFASAPDEVQSQVDGLLSVKAEKLAAQVEKLDA